MLKHRYNSLSESISDFDRMLDGMNQTQPLERKVDEDLLGLLRDEQELTRLEQQIEHVHRAIYGSGMPISEAETESIRKMHAHAAAMYNETADKAAARIKELDAEGSKVRTASLARMKDFHDKLRRRADAHTALASGPAKKKEMVASVHESAQPKRSSAMATMRRLAGIDTVVQMPRDPGVFGTTRFNEGYEAMAECGCDDAHEKSEKKDIKKIKKSADKLDGMHKDVEEGRSKEQQAAGLKKMVRAAKDAPGFPLFDPLKTNRDAVKSIARRGGATTTTAINKHLDRDLADKVTPWDPLAKGNKESAKDKLADARLHRLKKEDAEQSEGRSKEQQDKGHAAISDRASGRVPYERARNIRATDGAMRHGQDPQRAASLAIKRGKAHVSNRDPLASKFKNQNLLLKRR